MATRNFPNSSSFTGAGDVDINCFLERLEQHFDAFDIKEENKKVATLLISISDDVPI